MHRSASGATAFRLRRAFVPLVLLPTLLFSVAAVQNEPAARASRSSPDWFTINLDYSSQRYVDLDKITPKNVSSLTKVCEFDLNTPSWFSSGLLMVDGTIYVNTVLATYAIDAVSCEPKWVSPVGLGPWVAAVSSRGSAYFDKTIYRGTADGRVLALDAGTGATKWQVQAADPTRHEAFTSAPVAWGGRVFIGIVTADLGVRGRLMAFDAATGRELWRFNTIPLGIEPYADTWPAPPVSQTNPAGGAFWTSYSLDPATGEVFGPVSNPNPDYVRTTDGAANLFTNSVISLDATTGQLNWFCQTIAGDTHDWDLGTQPTLYRSRSGRQMLAIAGKEGYVIGIDRGSSPPAANNAMCQKDIVFKTPGTTVPAGPEPPVDSSLRLVCPGSIGGAQWNGTAYHPGLGILYAGMVDFCYYYSSQSYSDDPGFWLPLTGQQTVRPDFSKPPSGWITAMDGDTGKILWRYKTEAQVLAGLVPTKSGLLFGGDVRGNLLAFDARTGTLLKKIDAGGALNHGLISYSVDGKQYVAAAAGGVTLNPAGVSGPLRVVVYGLPELRQKPVAQVRASRLRPHLITSSSDAPPAYQALPQDAMTGAQLYTLICAGCHGFAAEGGPYPPLLRHTELVNDKNNYAVLKEFLRSVPPPMPIFYHGQTGGRQTPELLDDANVEAIGAYLKTLLSNPAVNNQLQNAAPLGYVYQQPTTTGSPQWQTIYKVLTFPRCINCHTSTVYPRQRDMRYPHIYSVVRGADDFGAPVARCQSCHGDKNNAANGIPGAPGWHIAPLAMSWESSPGIAKTGPELCSMLKDPLRNGGRSLEELYEHMKTPLVQWAWHPGTRWNGEHRTPPPVPYDEFLKAFREWVDATGPCPTQ